LINRLTELTGRKGENNIPLLQKLAIPVPVQAFASTR
jgi:hypothetical protein